MKFIFAFLILLLPLAVKAGGVIITGGFNDRAIQFAISTEDAKVQRQAERRLFAFAIRERAGGFLKKMVGNFENGVSICLEYENAREMDLAASRATNLIQSLEGTSGQSIAECP